MKEITTYSELYMEFPVTILGITSLHIEEKTNTHGLARAELVVLSENEYRFVDDIEHDTDIKIVLKQNEELKVIFVGMATKIEAKKVDANYYVHIELKSKTFKMDQKLRRRSFQNKDNLYTGLFAKIFEEYPGSRIYDVASNGQLQGESIIQYDETDWQFINRLASKLMSPVITNVSEAAPMVWIGVQEGSQYKQITHSFNLTKDNSDFLKADANFDGWMEEHKMSFRVRSVHSFQLLDEVTYENLTLKVLQKETDLENGFVVFTYDLAREAAVRKDLTVNPKILGASIDGKVLDITGDRVKLHLSIDDTQSIDEAYWYKCETSYTSEGQTGFYSMPQKGDSVKLYTPTEYNEEAYVRTVNRLDGKSNIKFKDPNIKYWGNVHKKELMMAPVELQITAVNGMIQLNMDNQDGMDFTSSSDIFISTEETAEITGKTINLRAGKEIILATKDSSLLIDKIINIKAEGGVSL